MLGATVPARGGYYAAFKKGDDWGCECIQLYITPSRTWRVPQLSQDEIVKFKTAWQKSKVKEVVAHVPYLVNLASADKVLWEKSVARLQIELFRADKLGISLLVLHPGSYSASTREEGIDRIILAVNRVLHNYNNKAKILLETMAGQGTMIGSNFEELNFILNKIARSQSMGICFDFGHIFMAGYDVRDRQRYEAVLAEFDKVIGLKKIKVIHLNDSKKDFGSQVDRHTSIGKGKIGLQVFQFIFQDKRFKHIPKLLELPEKETRESLKVLRKLINV
jgi:deoxyribonuclease-4